MSTVASTSALPRWQGESRLSGLRRFATAITLLNLLGHTLLGFEGSWAYPLVALVAAYTTEIALELVEAWSVRRPVRFLGGGEKLHDFLLAPHISAMAVSMLLYANASLAPIAFAACAAIASKSLLRVELGGRTRHVMNPSNFGIALTLICFPRVGIAPPYQFTENLAGVGDRLMPLVVIALGTFLNWRYTRRLPLIAGWLGGFLLQSLVRHLAFDQPITATWMPISGMAFLLFTFYMVTDPPTTPTRPWAQVAFGASVAAAYGVLMALHVVFGLFFGLAIVCTLRGTYLLAQARLASVRVGAPVPTRAAARVEPSLALSAQAREER